MQLDPDSFALMALGAALLAGFAAQVVGRKAHVPRVTLLLLLGLGLGPSALNVVPEAVTRWFPLVTTVALSMVGFMLGQQLTLKALRSRGRAALALSVGESVFASAAVLVAIYWLTASWTWALLLAALAPSTDPAATLDVIRELKARGPISRLVLSVVAIDDAWGILLFSALALVAQAVAGHAGGMSGPLVQVARELGGGALLGVVLGFPMAWLTGRIRTGSLTQIEALGFVFLAAGCAGALHLSPIVTCMAMGAVVANRARHHAEVFHAAEDAADPFLIVFFLLSGFSFHLDAFAPYATMAGAYVVARVLGKLLGATLSAKVGAVTTATGRQVGQCLLPQAGVALGLALSAAERFGKQGQALVSILVVTTVAFEVVGPLVTRFTLTRAGEAASGR